MRVRLPLPALRDRGAGPRAYTRQGGSTLFDNPARPSTPLSARQRAIVAAAFVVGGLARLYYALVLHPAQRHVYSDMQDYLVRALKAVPADITDTLHPPGMSVFLARMHQWDPTWKVFAGVQALLSFGAMVLVWLIARRLYGNATAVVALVLASVYFPFVHYAGFFLTENPFTFFCLLALWLFIGAIDASAARRAALCAFGAGLAAGVAVSFKTSIFAPLLVLGVVYVAYAIRHRRPHPALVVASSLLGLAVLMVPMTIRCTRLSEGHFCPAASNLALNILMGHYGKKGAFHWHDRPRGIEIWYESPTTVLRGYRDGVDLDFGAYESYPNLALAVRWSAEHPAEALRSSFMHVYDLFAPPTLWPRAELWERDWGAIYQRLFWCLILPPAAIRIATSARSMLALATRSLPEWLLLAPVIGLMATAFVTLGEVRYRIPFDGFLIVLAARSYASLATRIGEIRRECERPYTVGL